MASVCLTRKDKFVRENCFDLDVTNSIGSNIVETISRCEKLYDRNIAKIAEDVISNNQHLIMLTGPSSSGKTTTAFKIQKELEKNGVACATVSLDCFFKNKTEIGFDAQGKPDFEKPQALELDLVATKLNELQTHGKAMLPVFDFLTGIRTDDVKKVDLRGGVAIIEGIHALNPLILDHLCTNDVYKVYISVHSGFEKQGSEVLCKRNVRFIRRLVRDYKFRGSSADNTFMLWENVVKDEVKYVLPYKVNANIRIDTTFPYEVGMLKKDALEILGQVEENSQYLENAVSLIKSIELFKEYDSSLLGSASLLREFCGGSEFEY